MRTQQEILDRISEVASDDFMGFQRSDLMDFLDFENVKSFLKEGTTNDQWKESQKENTEEAIKITMFEYMPFAWEKANGMRGISANRSIDHFTSWLWLYGDDELLKRFEDVEYEHYGKEKLIIICDHFGWDWKEWDDGERTNG